MKSRSIIMQETIVPVKSQGLLGYVSELHMTVRFETKIKLWTYSVRMCRGRVFLKEATELCIGCCTESTYINSSLYILS